MLLTRLRSRLVFLLFVTFAKCQTLNESTTYSSAEESTTGPTSQDLDERFSLPGAVLFPEGDPNSCMTPSNTEGLCVEIKFCSALRRVNLNSRRQYICGFQGSTPLLCCEGLQNLRPAPQPAPHPYPKPRPAPPPQPQSDRRPPKPAFLPEDCGVGTIQANRIVGGREAAIGAYPWIVAVFVILNNEKLHICGATLVSNRHIVSAAHCFFDNQHRIPYQIYRMRLGDYDITKDNDVEGTIELPILGYKTHPNYVRKTYLNDISLSFLTEEVQFTRTIKPACLPYVGFDYDLTSTRAIVAGWGYTKYQGGASTDILKETEIPVWSLEACAKAFKSELNVTDKYLCAGDADGKTDSCQGDSGGPLVLWGEDNRFYLMGVVSFGKRCATPGYPGAYTRITKQLQWLNDNF